MSAKKETRWDRFQKLSKKLSESREFGGKGATNAILLNIAGSLAVIADAMDPGQKMTGADLLDMLTGGKVNLNDE